MKTKWIITFIATVGLSACASKKAETNKALSPDSIAVFILKREQVTKTLTLPAQLLPWERAEIFAKVEGYVHELRVDIGVRVHRNDVLAVLDAPEVTANYAKAYSDLQGSQSRYKTSLDNYQRTFEAAKERGTISDSELLRVKNQMLSDSASYEAAKSSANAYAQIKAYLTLRSAFDGIVTQRNVDVGTLVGTSQKPMFVVENLHKVRLRVAIPELYTSTIPEEKSITFAVDAVPSKTFTGSLARKSNLIDESTRTELWEFEVENKEGVLKSGMYVNVNFNVKRENTSFVVPFSAVVTNLEKSFVIRISNGKTEWVDVRNGIAMKDKLEISGPLNENDQLVVKANDEIKADQQVVVKIK
jgi:membrane fusion protein, multidrug efflux system